MTILRIRPGETREQFAQRVADAAPPPSPELCALLARLLPMPREDSRLEGSPSGRETDG
jgi:hypothetical protein